MSEQQSAQTLLRLSDIDVTILRLQKQLDELPHRQQILEVRRKKRELDTKAAQVQKMAGETSRTLQLLNDETELNEGQLARVQEAMNESTEYRETSSLVAEMDMLSKRRAKLEEDSLALLEKQEKITSVEEQVAEAGKRLEAEEQAYTAAYRQAGGKLKQEISDLEHAREVLVATLPSDLSQRYSRAVTNKAGVGAAHLAGNQCSGCHGTLSEGQLAKLQEGPAVGVCPNCNRLIVTQQEGS